MNLRRLNHLVLPSVLLVVARPSPAHADAELITRVNALQAQREFAKAERLVAEALVAQTAPLQRADLLLLAAKVQGELGQRKSAADSAEEAWRLREAQLGQQAAPTLAALNEFVGRCGAAYRGGACLEPAAEAVRRAEQTLSAVGSDDAGAQLAAALRAQALVHNAVGRTAQAVPILERAISLWQAHGGLDRHAEHIFSAQTGLAVVLGNLERPALALALLDQLLPKQRQHLGDEAKDVRATLRTRVRMLNALGRVDEAAAQATEMVELSSAAMGARHPTTLDARQQLGVALIQAGQPKQARAVLDALAIDAQAVLDPDSHQALQVRYYQALALRLSGEWGRSAAALAAVLADASALGPEHPDQVTFAGVYTESLLWAAQAGPAELLLAGVGSQTSEQAVATALAQQAALIDRMTQQLGARDRRTLIARVNLLRHRLMLGQAPALDEAAQLRDAMIQVYGADHPTTLSARSYYFETLARQARAPELTRAIDGLREVLALRLTQLGPRHEMVLANRSTLGLLLARRGEPEEALAQLDALATGVDALRRSLAPLGAAVQAQTVAAYQPGLARRVELLAGAGRLEEAFVALENHKGRALLAQMTRQQALDRAAELDLPDDLRARLRRLAGQVNHLTSQAGAATSRERREPLLLELTARQLALDTALAEAARLSPRVARLLDVATDPIAAARLLPARAVLVHYLQGPDHQWSALLRRADGATRWVALPDAGPGLAADIDALHRTLAQGPASEKQGGDLRARLGQALLAPLQPALTALGEPRHLLVSPDGPLAVLPWDTLTVAGRPALARWAFSQTPSVSVMVQGTSSTARGSASAPSRPALLALAASNVGAVGGTTWSALPFAELEARQATALFRTQGALALSGADASEGRLRRIAGSGDLSRYRQLLVAAHGSFDARRPQAQAMVLSPEDPADPQRDGLLTVADWFALPLRTDLVVLSGCDTAQGSLLAGEGLIGFAYALNVAGNRNLLATLWPVSDAGGAQFVVAFLRRLRALPTELPGAAAITHALATTKRAFAAHPDPRLNSPRVWAAYTLIGQ
ncbi:CHAT domain-containing tetratricopeptide repeat protein [Roseateles sp. LKC17W]|uniref:CHAT domain-containing protein n=1 Tax=Pelomonas margarita TaxID=3299031 RepID=A0ABW7FE52_9BURK